MDVGESQFGFRMVFEREMLCLLSMCLCKDQKVYVGFTDYINACFKVRQDHLMKLLETKHLN